jgi:primary-amine oxidase
MRNSILFVSAAALCLLFTRVSAQSAVPTYPLDPLTAAEMKNVVTILKSNHLTTTNTYFNIINLKEPPKAEVLAYQHGATSQPAPTSQPGAAPQPTTPFRREAFVSFYDYANPGMTEAIVDLNTNTVLSTKTIPNVIGMGLEADSLAAENIVRKDPAWAAALQKRGISIDQVTHRTIFPGDLGIAPIGHREQLVIPRRKGNKVDIEGLLAYIDFTTGKVLKIVDEQNRFSDRIDLNYFDEDSIRATKKGPNPGPNSGPNSGPKPIRITQPEGSSITMNGQEISWQNWRLRYGIDNREGLIIYNVRYVDNGKERPVMYKGSMPEMVVPYGAPSLLQAAYNFFDAGEYLLRTRHASSGERRPLPVGKGSSHLRGIWRYPLAPWHCIEKGNEPRHQILHPDRKL